MAPIFVGWVLAIGLSIKRSKLGLLTSALGGLIISGYLGKQHIDQSGTSACSVNERFDCAAVNLSRYGTLDGHLEFLPSIPLSFLGFAFYAAVLALAIVSLSDDSNQEEKSFEKGGTLIVWFGGLSILLSIYLAYISSVKLNKWCLYCIGMYGFNATIFLSGFLWSRSSQTDKTLFEDSSIKVFTGILVAMTIVSLIASPKGKTTKSTKAPGEATGSWEIEKLSTSMTLDGSEPVYGSPSAPYTVVEFADFQCPHCALTTPEVKKVISRHKGVAKLVYKHYPLSSICNPNISGLFHENACIAAYAADCAQEQGKFWDMTKLIFKNQDYLSERDLEFIAQQIKLDLDSYQTCLQKSEIKEGIESDIKAADGIGVEGTPALFLHDGDVWWKVLEQAEGLEATLIMLSEGKTPPGAKKKEAPSVPKPTESEKPAEN
ncbi:MAG: thioredoxin domain-containing protein [Myxococcota bacterium]|nr:thioredoxin domain-containing protein [Myxococcota bacterium]